MYWPGLPTVAAAEETLTMAPLPDHAMSPTARRAQEVAEHIDAQGLAHAFGLCVDQPPIGAAGPGVALVDIVLVRAVDTDGQESAPGSEDSGGDLLGGRVMRAVPRDDVMAVGRKTCADRGTDMPLLPPVTLVTGCRMRNL